MTADDPLDLLASALKQNCEIISRIRPDQANLPTPCSEWDVRALVNHIVYDLRAFTASVDGGERPSTDEDLIDLTGRSPTSRLLTRSPKPGAGEASSGPCGSAQARGRQPGWPQCTSPDRRSTAGILPVLPGTQPTWIQK